MNARKVIIGCLSGIVLFGIDPAGSVAFADRCISNPGNGPDICVE